MNRESFINYIENNQLLGKESISDLIDLSKEFPYCSTVRILLAMNLQKEDHFKYDSELKQAAIYAADRSILRNHLEQLSTSDETTVLPDEHIELVEEVDEEAEEQTEVTFKEELVRETEEPNETEPEEIAETESVQDIPDINEEVAVTVDEGELQEIEIVVDELQQAVEKIEDEQETIENPEREKEDTLAELRKLVAGRLKQIEKEREAKEETVSEVLEEEIPEKVKPPKKKKQDKAISELIDNFIKSEPSITRRQAAFFDPVDAAKDSVTDDENIVSETLADIYFGQRKFEKAIRIYKKLSLKFPEKSSYFAARIEKAVEELKK